MAKQLATAFAIAMSLATVVPASAFWLGALYDKTEQGRKENNQWPQKFVAADRRNAMAPFEAMVRNGWRRENLLGKHHFNEDCTQLTDAGKLRVQWILTQNPVEYRQVYVERSLREDMTEARIASTQEFASEVLGGIDSPSVFSTHIISDGRPATTVNFVNTNFRENMPTPALPEGVAGGAVSGE